MLVQVQGRPGVLRDTETDLLYVQTEVREDNVYDTVEYASSTMSTGTVDVFQDLNNKKRKDTNLATQHKISANNVLNMSQIGVHVRQAVGNRISGLKDIIKLYENLVLTFKLNTRLVAESPLVFGFQSGYGIQGISVQTDFSTGTLGVPSRAATDRLERTQLVNSDDELNATLELFTASWHVTAGSYAAPVLDQYNDVSVIVRGIIGKPLGT